MSFCLIAKTPVERRVADALNPLLNSMGFELVRVRLLSNKNKTLQVMVERPDGGIEIDDCAKLSTAISSLLDVEEAINDAYTLEVSSPGIDRPLTRAKDFDAFRGWETKVETDVAIDGRRQFRGTLRGLENDEVLLDVSEGTIGLKVNWLRNAKLVMSDHLIAQSLKNRRKNAAHIDNDGAAETSPIAQK
ncbi:MAG: ribosome maturation factor RimP [Aestuariivita sp.]|nr:ribosome maturation factor RimP [Aestuariivita sp.]MCY4203120.1 ribosome maturation factor RimP [Aestuariivita sp.]MCY4287497.1 ribosome maturation factor RimP [Aestuariivita sp.]MCY4345861.1 ribosome maturation factor RimP [Aestuariivita sp.]